MGVPDQKRHNGERGDGLVETFGKKSHGVELAGMGFELLEVEEGNGGFSGDGYHNPKQLHQAFDELVAKYPKYAKIYDLTKEYNQEKTVEGRSLYAIKVSDNVGDDESEPNVLIVSNHHARELITPELALDAARRMLDGVDTAHRLESGELRLGEGEDDLDEDEAQEAKDLKKMIDESQVYVMWTMNPEGLNTVWENDAWKRTNGRNVDLNRNYPIGWQLSCGGSPDSSGETWRGPKPFSEPETKTMRAFQDNRNFAKVMDFHSYAEQVRTNYGNCAHLPKDIDDHFKVIRNSVADKMDYQASRSCCMGGDIHYAYNRHGSLAYLVETGTSFQPPAHEKDNVVKDVWPGIKRFVQQPISVSGVITDEKSGKPVEADIKLADYTFTQGEKFHSGKQGHYHLWLPNGKHKIQVRAPGKEMKELEVEAKDGGNVHHIKV